MTTEELVRELGRRDDRLVLACDIVEAWGELARTLDLNADGEVSAADVVEEANALYAKLLHLGYEP